MEIDFVTFITKYSAGYAEYLKYTAKKFLSKKHEINWKYIETVGAERLPKGYKRVASVGTTGYKRKHNSKKHADALHEALNHIEHEYVVFIDSDIAIVYKDWDDVIVNELDNYDCFGGAYSSESDDKFNKIRYKKFPTVNFFAFKKELLDKIKLDFNPFKGDVFTYNISNDKEAIVFGIDKGHKFCCDTGWKLPMLFHDNNLSHNYMPMHLMTSENRQLPFVNNKNKNLCLKKEYCMNEWHYNGKLFATHKKQGRHNPIDGVWGTLWKKRVELYIKGM